MAETMVPGEQRAGVPEEFNHLPATRSGKWSMWLAAVFAIGFVLNMFLVGAFGRTGAPEWLRTVILPVWGITLMASGVFAGLVGLFAILKAKERSFAVWLALVPGAFAILFVVGEFAFPH